MKFKIHKKEFIVIKLDVGARQLINFIAEFFWKWYTEQFTTWKHIMHSLPLFSWGFFSFTSLLKKISKCKHFNKIARNTNSSKIFDRKIVKKWQLGFLCVLLWYLSFLLICLSRFDSRSGIIFNSFIFRTLFWSGIFSFEGFVRTVKFLTVYK